ncbi:TRAP transporter substrate-binding protein [Clostridium formicaceticum]|uniref:2,3-diketo-L-gulonate-binding periplasmic protein YiaO n=1 Tax=Clostridium formicaceticum TaxID=1497 RepID=A0AAC9RIK3_9CLOT|nr:TRAP transporter substrate-binding protein [Clostridium formicaceticum]AOY76090.1 C4-dicarboxylate ABC transporter substrate-binding protein [Clostridium formicaceticum]ARE86452.1 2,3-diketo-L-gulonate-binding periplasmic protein YiaO precursor [Clostridium formicaceticum]
MKKKITILLSILLLMSLTLAACSSSPAGTSAGGSVEFNVGHSASETSPVGQGLVKFKELVEEKTDGRYQIQIFHNGQLGAERDLVEGAQLGSIDMAIANQGPMTNFAPSLAAVDLPYLIRSYEHADNIFLGEIGKAFMEEIDAAGLKTLGFWESGFRNLTNSKQPVNSVADVKGLKIRTMENQAHQGLWRALGADPVPMSWGEAYTGMQQGALDGQENPLSVILQMNVAEVNKHLAMTEHVYASVVFIMSPNAWNSLSAEDQAIFGEAAYEAGLYQRQVQRDMNNSALEELEKLGMQVTYPDKQEFIDASENFKREFGQRYEDIINKINELED